MARLSALAISALVASAHFACAEEKAGKPSAAGSLLGFGKALIKQIVEGPEPLPPDEGKLTVAETILAVVPTNVPLTELLISPDQRRVAYIDKQAAGAMVVVNGKAGLRYDEVDSFRFSPDSRRFAYAARRDGQQFVLVDGVEGAPYCPWRDMYPIFSPDSKRVAYMARLEKVSFVVVDEVRGEPFRSLDLQSHPVVVFSPDSRRFAYLSVLGDGRQAVVVDGVMGKPYGSVDLPAFSPDSKRWIHKAHDHDGSYAVVDGIAGPAFDTAWVWMKGGTHFSADSRRVAYVAEVKGAGDVMVLDGVAGKPYEEIGPQAVIFSPNSTDTVYVARGGGQAWVVTNGVEGPRFDGIEIEPRFSPDGAHMVYVARREFKREFKRVAVCDGQEGATYVDLRCAPVFSPDSKRLAYAADKGLFSWVMLCDGQEVATNFSGDAWRTDLLFSPDSKRFAYRVAPADYVVVDGRRSRFYGQVMWHNPVFSPDSAHVAYWATHAPRRWRVFVDASYSKEYDNHLWNSKLVFDGPTNLQALAVRDRTVLLLEMRIGGS